MRNLLLSIGLKVQLPITMRVDNAGAIVNSENFNVSQRTKHIDTRTKFLTEYIEDGVIKIVFVKSEDNLSDSLTKNVSGEIYNNHLGAYVGDKKSTVQDP